MKVEELRAELQQRGLATTGIKPTLVCFAFYSYIFLLLLLFNYYYNKYYIQKVRRLEAAWRKEKKQGVAVDSDCNSSNKRSRDEAQGNNINHFSFLFHSKVEIMLSYFLVRT